MNTDEFNYKKLDEDDILEIILEHFQESLEKSQFARGILLGKAGKDLRFVGIFTDEYNENVKDFDLVKLDMETKYNGEHQFLKDNPDFFVQ